jgi:exonuclease VII large subunit
MTERSVAEILTDLDTLLRPARTVAVTGRLTDWRVHRSGMATAELSCGDPPTARIRVVAGRHAATSATDDLTDAGRTTATAGTVTMHGQVAIHPRWGLQLTLFRLACVGAHDQPWRIIGDRPNGDTPWPERIDTIGLVAPGGGDDAHADVAAHCANSGLTIVEQRVTVTGARAAVAIGQALDRLALDPRPDVTLLVRGGGPSSDFTPFNSSIVIAAIGRHPRPVITGLGHADNHTTADQAAHTSCITPTAAAQLAAPMHHSRQVADTTVMHSMDRPASPIRPGSERRLPSSPPS